MTKRLLIVLTALMLALSACQDGAADQTTDPDGGEGELPTVEVDVTGENVEAIQEAGELRCGVKYDVRGFGFNNPESGEIEGLEADLCRIIADAMGVEPQFSEAISANRIPFLQEDTVDIVISTMTRNAEREEQIDFSHVYYMAGQSILVKEDSDIQNVDDLNGRTVCSGEGSTSEKNVRDLAPDAELLLFGTYTEAGQALADGRCEAVSTDDTILFGLAEQFEGTELRGGVFTEEPLAIGIKKGREDLVQFVDAVLEQLKENGGLTQLYEQWVEPYTGEVPEVPF